MTIRIDGTNTAANPGITGADADTGLQFGTDEIKVVTGGTEAITVDANQRVGIGTSSPGYLIDASNSSAPTLRLTDSIRHLLVRGGSTTQDPGIGTDYAGALSFFTNGTANERARIDSSGRLLVGTSTSIGSASGNYPIQAVATGAGGGAVASLGLSFTPDAAGYILGGVEFNSLATSWKAGASILGASDGVHSSTSRPSRLVFFTTADGASSPTERMRITSAGYVGFNTSLFPHTGQLATNVGTNYYNFGANNSNAFIIYNAAGTGVYLVSGNTGWSANSDERLKTNLEPIADGLNKVGTLRAVTGRYKTDDETVSRSFLIAQDVQQVLPEAVDVQEDEDKVLGLRYTEVIPLLVAALKESKERIETLEAQNAQFEARLTALEGGTN